MATITIARPSETTTGENPMFTCLSCTIAFPSAEDQRNHYRSEHHRYNMKRRVAGLPPVSLVIFDQKVADRKVETAVMSSSRGSTCEICKKTYTTENAYRSHINSKKHRDNELNAAIRLSLASSTPVQETTTTSTDQQTATDVTQTAALSHAPDVDDAAVATRADSDPDADEDEDDMNETIDAKIAAARARLSPTHCLFCSSTSSSIDDNLSHMHSAHSFFVPEADYLVDLPGLLTYLGEKIAVGNVCIYCNGKGREFRTLNAVRKHMLDKGHCKIAYDSQRDQLEISDYYDFRSSYPDAEERAAKRKARKNKAIVPEAEAEGAWEDVSDDGSEADEIVEQSGSEPEESDSEDEESDDESLPDNPITYGDTPYELVLANGSRIGHRSMKRYYAQSFSGARGRKPEDPNSGAALVRKLLADKNSALVPTKGGFGAFGAGTQVVKARNRGEAREAGRHLREFRDQTRKEQYKTRVGFQNNHQKHYRDPLLQ